MLLPSPSEDAISENLDKRLKRGIIYTYIGNVLVSVNPFEQLPLYVRAGVAPVFLCHTMTMYGGEWVQRYCGKMIYELPPHVYAVAEDAFRHARRVLQPAAASNAQPPPAGPCSWKKSLSA